MRNSLWLILAACGALYAQPTVVSVSPANNVESAPAGSDVQADFSTNMGAVPSGAIVVSGSQTGIRTGSITGGGTAQLRFDPAVDFFGGERIEVTYTDALTDSSLNPLDPPYVQRFRAATTPTNGTFASSVDISARNETDVIVAADMDGDGYNDLITGEYNGQNQVLLNDGAGGFATSLSWGSGIDKTSSIVAGDLNGDGAVDVVQSTPTGVQVFLNNGSGVLSPGGSSSRSMVVAQGIALGDMDADGDLDVIAAARDDQGDYPAVLPNDGTGVLGTPINFGSNTINYRSLDVGDIDRDGDLDVVVVSNNILWIFGNDGTGVMTQLGTASPSTSSMEINQIALLDIDNDGYLDCVVADRLYRCRWALNNGSGAFATWTTINTTDTRGIDVGDLNGDGYVDLVVFSTTGNNSYYFNTGGALPFSTSGSLPYRDTNDVCCADLTADGALDFAGATGTVFQDDEDYVMFARIFEGLLEFGPLAEPTQISSTTVGPVDVFDFRITDLGTSSGNQLWIDKIFLQVTGDGPTGDHTWRISDGGALNLVGSASGTEVTFNVSTGQPLWYQIPDNSTVTFTVSVELGPTPAATNDGHTFDISLAPGNVFLRGVGVFDASSSTPDNSPGLVYGVMATELRVTQQPPVAVQDGVAFDVQCAYTDLNGNVDQDISGDVVSLSRSDGGTVLQGTSALTSQGVADFSGANAVVLGSPENSSLQLVMADDAGGSIAIGTPALTNAFSLSVDDTDALLTSGPLVEPTVLDSVAGAAAAVDVLDFRIVDQGTGDNKPTVITEIRADLAGSSADGADVVWTLAGPGAGVAGSVQGAVGSQEILFTGLSVSVANGATATFQIAALVAPQPAGTVDGEKWEVVVRTSGVTLGAGSTSFAPGQPGVANLPSGLTYDVVATVLVLIQQPPTQIQAGTAFDMELEFRDAAGNLDLGVDGDVVDVQRSDGGTITDGNSAAAVEGVVSFSGVDALVVGGPAAVGIRLQFVDRSAGVVDISGSIFESAAFDVLVTPVAIPNVTIVAASAAVIEGETVTAFHVRVGAAQPSNLSIGFSLTGTADTAPGQDYTLTGVGVTHLASGGALQIPAGETTIRILISAVEDSLDEGREAAYIQLTAGAGYDLSPIASTSIDIQDSSFGGSDDGDDGDETCSAAESTGLWWCIVPLLLLRILYMRRRT